MSCMLILRKICTHRIKRNRRKVGILHFIHNLANPFICSHIIIKAMQRCHPDSRFLAATAIMQHIMARAKPLVLSEMIEIGFTCMSCHRFCHVEQLRLACAQEGIPEPFVRNKLCVLPCTATNIIFPSVAKRIVAMHYITIIPKAIPTALLNFLKIKAPYAFQRFLCLPMTLRIVLRQAVSTEYTRCDIALLITHEQWRIFTATSKLLQLLLLRRSCCKMKLAFCRMPDAVRGTSQLIGSFIGGANMRCRVKMP